MHVRGLLAAIVVLWWTSTSPAVEFPYTAYVNTADVYVRGGPGQNYYPTDKLQKGARVEIYRHDPGGWYAIRPPRGSFSWVASRHLDVAGHMLAKVNTKRAVARVGSAFSETRDVIQVRLEEGEKLELLQPKTDDSPWCKIAPPSGEFRWIFSKYVDRDGPLDDELDDQPSRDTASAMRDDNVRPASGVDAAKPNEGAKPAEAASGTEPRVATRQAPRKSLPTNTSFQRELDSIEVGLSAIVAEDISTWKFDDVSKRAETLLKNAETAIDRGRARVLLNKLARFEEIKQRSDTLRRPPGEQMGQLASGTGTASSSLASTIASRRAADPRYDGVGRLSPVVTQKSGGPQYALVDGSNAVISFITPAPGVNLRPYIDKQVGVNGQRGYLTDLQRQHISVQRVTLLDTERR